MENKQFITKIVTDTLNSGYFIVGDFYDVTYVSTERYLATCIESNNQAVKLLLIAVLSQSSTPSYKGRLIIIDNKNLNDFASIRSFNSEVGDLPSGDGLGIILRQKE